MAIRLVGVRFILTVFPVLAVNHRGTLHLHAKTSDNGDLSKFLESNMESSDRGIVNTNYLNEDLDLAQKYRAEASFAWGDIPEDDFAKYVAPYKAATETPCKWRQRFHNQFWDKVKGLSKGDAVKFLNKEAFSYLNVTYKKEYPNHKPDQNIEESEKLNFASCTGLSIILVCACRSVGIPARLAMTPAWVTGSTKEERKSGLTGENQNHSWVEVKINGKWHYIGASEESEFDKTWFTAQAANAIPATKSDYVHSIYAVTFEKQQETETCTAPTRMVAPWSDTKQINVVEVIDRYQPSS